MKKILLFILLLFLGFSYGYSQYVPIQIVTEYDDPFLRHLPLNQMVYCKDSDAVYMLDIPAFPISKLSTTANHRVIGFTLDTTGFVMWTDTTSIIATKHDVDTLSNSVYDSLGNHYDLIHALDTGKVSTSGDIMYGDLTVNAKINAIDTIKAPYIKITNQYTLPTTDGTNGQGIVTDGAGTLTWGMSFDSLKCYSKLFMDSIESCTTQLYLNADTTKFSNNIKLPKFANNTTEPVLKVLPSGRIDTNQTRSIMGLYLDSLDVGKIDLTTLNVTTANIVTSNIVTSIEQNLVLPNFGSNYKPVLSIANLSGNVDTTQVKSILGVTLDSLKIDKYVVIGDVKSEDVKFTLADDGVYSFIKTSYGFANLYSYNAGKMTALVRYTFDIDGTIYMETSTALVNGADADGYEICLYYSAGSYYIKNTSGGARNYILSIKYY